MNLRTFCLLLIIICSGIEIKAQDNAQLFSFTDEVDLEWNSKTKADIKRAPIEFDEKLLRNIKDGDLTEFQIATFENEVLEVKVKRVINHFNDDWSITGIIDNNWQNSFTLSVSDGTILSSINNISSHSFFEIVYSNEEQFHSFIKVDPHKKDELTCGVDNEYHKTGTSIKGKTVPSQGVSEETTVIDVMIIYTERAELWADLNQGSIRNVVNQAMANAQNAVDNSEIDLEFRLVHSEMIDYTESGSSSTDLRRLTTSPSYTGLGSEYIGYMNEVHEMRELHKADLVAMFTDATDTGGLAWLLRNEEGDSRFGFSITRIQQAASLTHAHEMGHNMGNAHSRFQQNNPAGSDGGLFPYSTGWRWVGDNGEGLTSVMTYDEEDTKIPIYSNPEVLVEGVPSGSYTESFSPADNARSMTEIKHVISSYKEAIGIPVVQLDSLYDITAGKAEASVTVSEQGESKIKSQGVCWSIYPQPNISDLCVASSLKTVSTFSLTVRGLIGNTTYYIRSYATNNGGTAYSEDIQFKTENISNNSSVVTASRDKVLATGNQESIISVTVLNDKSEPVENVEVQLEQEGGISEITVINSITDENGGASFSVISRNENKILYTAVANDLPLNNKVEIEYLFSDPVIFLGNNYPNPYREQTIIPIVIPEPTAVKIDVFSSTGAKIQTILDQQMNEGYFEIPFNANGLASGVYLYRLSTNSEIKSNTMLLIK